MKTISRDIFRAIHENKWLSIEYKNKQEEITKYWIGIIDVNPLTKTLLVEGLHLEKCTILELHIYLDSILSSTVIEGSYYEVPEVLKEDICMNPHRYESIFHNVSNLKLLNYYNNKLKICSQSKEQRPLTFVDVPDNQTYSKNTAPLEADEIVKYAAMNKDKKIAVITPFVNQRELINEKLKENGLSDITCGTVHAFQGDEKDVVLFSLALTDRTGRGTYEWLKNNKELINVAVSRAKERLIVLSSDQELERLHAGSDDDDLYELVQYVKHNGETKVTPKTNASRALGIKPYSTETEQAFLENLNHALDNVLNTNQKCIVQKEVSIAHVFQDNSSYNDLFYTGRFDFVVYERQGRTKVDIPILAIELDGREHQENAVVMERDRKKNEICREHGFELIRIENTYARRYQFMKEILMKYFASVK